MEKLWPRDRSPLYVPLSVHGLANDCSPNTCFSIFIWIALLPFEVSNHHPQHSLLSLVQYFGVLCFERKANTKQQRQFWDYLIKPSHERKKIPPLTHSLRLSLALKDIVVITVMYSASTKLCLLVDKRFTCIFCVVKNKNYTNCLW